MNQEEQSQEIPAIEIIADEKQTMEYLLSRANKNYRDNGNHLYFVDTCLKQDSMIQLI